MQIRASLSNKGNKNRINGSQRQGPEGSLTIKFVRANKGMRALGRPGRGLTIKLVRAGEGPLGQELCDV